MPVIIKKIKNGIENTVIEALEEINYRPKKERILIKPNIVNSFPPNSPYITSVNVVRGIIYYLKRLSIRDIIVAEGPINNDPQFTFDSSGFSKMCRDENVALLDLNNAERINVPWHQGEILIPRIVMESEYINVAKLKTHIQTTVTLGLKNNKGVLRLADKRKFHLNNLHESIANLARIIPVSLSVIDATKGVEGSGPGSMGQVIHDMNLIIAGANILAVDIVAAKIMGIDPDNVQHLYIARRMRYFEEDEVIVGEKIDSVKRVFALPSTYHKIFNIYCWWEETTCSGCIGIFGELKKKAKNPYYLWRLFLYGFIKRLDFVTGKMKQPPNNHGKIICLGTCSKQLAKRHGFVYIDGCPPNPIDVIKKI